MRKFIIILSILILSLATTRVYAGTNVGVAWDPNTENDLAGYKIYRSDVSGQYDLLKPALDIKCKANDVACAKGVDENVPDGTWFWVITAYDEAGNESEFSNEITNPEPFDTTGPDSPKNPKITITVTTTVKVSN